MVSVQRGDPARTFCPLIHLLTSFDNIMHRHQCKQTFNVVGGHEAQRVQSDPPPCLNLASAVAKCLTRGLMGRMANGEDTGLTALGKTRLIQTFLPFTAPTVNHVGIQSWLRDFVGRAREGMLTCGVSVGWLVLTPQGGTIELGNFHHGLPDQARTIAEASLDLDCQSMGMPQALAQRNSKPIVQRMTLMGVLEQHKKNLAVG